MKTCVCGNCRRVVFERDGLAVEHGLRAVNGFVPCTGSGRVPAAISRLSGHKAAEQHAAGVPECDPATGEPTGDTRGVA